MISSIPFFIHSDLRSRLKMSNLLPSNWGFSGRTSKGSLAGDSPSKEEEMSFINTAEPAQWTQRPSANESSSFYDIFQILSDIHLQEPLATTSDNIPTTKNNRGASEHGEPSNNTRKRRVEELELHKCLSEGNEQLSTDMKIREDQKTRKTRSAETHNMAERRRRGRIKEKIRSLQHLMPNCEKRDCASILDEAVEYLKTLKAQSQMMSMSMGTVYYNPYTSSATGIANMPIIQYSPYAPFRPGMGLVPFPSPTLTPSGILPLVQSSMELHPSLPISGTSGLPSVQPTYTVGPPLLLDNRSKKGPVFEESEMVASQEASTSGQISSKSSPGSIVHATHIVPSSTEGQETNL